MRAIWHRHAFQAVAVSQILRSPIKAHPDSVADLKVAVDSMNECLRNGVGIAQTQILKRCACGAVKVEKIDGNWTLNQVRGLAEKESA
jgi:hypothetical protein